jgi:presenilin-like A22 family membrane protease
LVPEEWAPWGKIQPRHILPVFVVVVVVIVVVVFIFVVIIAIIIIIVVVAAFIFVSIIVIVVVVIIIWRQRRCWQLDFGGSIGCIVITIERPRRKEWQWRRCWEIADQCAKKRSFITNESTSMVSLKIFVISLKIFSWELWRPWHILPVFVIVVVVFIFVVIIAIIVIIVVVADFIFVSIIGIVIVVVVIFIFHWRRCWWQPDIERSTVEGRTGLTEGHAPIVGETLS